MVSFHVCAIMKFTKHGKTCVLVSVFMGLLSNWYALPNF